jgi:polyphosphate glucokinase
MNNSLLPRTLAIDIGGSGVKAIVLDPSGKPITTRQRLATPQPPIPAAVLPVIDTIVASEIKAAGDVERISVGFPGVVQRGITKNAMNLGPTWDGFNLLAELEKRYGKPVRIANDADVQGYGAMQGRGVELVITLGTGFGSALFVDGRLVPNLEMGQHTFRHNQSFEDELGQNALGQISYDIWNQRLLDAIHSLERLFNYDLLYIGGGNARLINVPLPANVSIVSNDLGLLGGIALWRE